jgi:AcrR family transcriptional regulator
MARTGAATTGDSEARRDQVLRAAEALFARHGYRGVGLREIAAQVGIRAPSLFKHFPNKKALYNAVLRNIFARLTELTAHSLKGEGDYERRLREFMERPEAMEPVTRSKAFVIYRRLDAFLRDGARAGEFRAVDRFDFQIALTGAILYYGIAARPYQAALHRNLSAPDPESWKKTVLEIARGARLANRGSKGVAERPRRRRPRA